jgi:hypothetical protein
MIRTNADCAPKRKWGSYVLLLVAALFLSVPASAAEKRTDPRTARRVERVDRHQSKRRDVPHNARYKNPPREDRSRREKQVSSWNRSRSDDHRDRGDYDRHDGDKRRYDRHRGKHDGRHDYGKSHHHHKHHYRTRVYHHYEYVPYYAPAVVAYPYYCDLCHSGFYAEHLFYDHLHHAHYLTHALIPSLLHWHGGTFFYFGWGG